MQVTPKQSLAEQQLDLARLADAQAFLELAQRDWPGESARRIQLWREQAQARVQSGQSMQLLKGLIATGRMSKAQ